MLHGNLKMLEKTGRLQEAVGEQHAKELTSHADLANQTRKQILKNQSVAKIAGKVAGYGALATAGGGVVKHLAAE
jgi:hypothetical protein